MNSIMLDSPLGSIRVWSEGGAIVRLRWSRKGTPPARGGVDDHDPLLVEAGRQLAAYFAGTLRQFRLPLAAAGTAFQKRVFSAMCAIPYGSTRTYQDIADDLGAVARAVGQACGSNPIPVIIPCHRVLGRHGLGGFSSAGGVEDKIRLLALEGASPVLL